MFESWLLNLLATHLGRFVDVQKDQLKISLWSGVVLENVNLQSAALDYLQLPIQIQSGTIGRLQIQVPWRYLGSKPFIIEISELSLLLCPRTESQWEHTEASNRYHSAKRAALAANELNSLQYLEDYQQSQDKQQQGPTSPKAKTKEYKQQQAPQWKQSLLSTLTEQLLALLLSRLKLTITDIHIQFRENCQEGINIESGLCINRLETCNEYDLSQYIHSYEENRGFPSVTSPLAAEKSKRLQRHILVSGCSLYWHQYNNGIVEYIEVINTQRGNIMEATDIGIILTIGSNPNVEEKIQQNQGLGSALEVELIADRVILSVSNIQWNSINRTVDNVKVWSLRNKYARFRPHGMSDTRVRKDWRYVWQYAILSVQDDVKRSKPPWWEWSYSVWSTYRKRLISLYSRKIMIKLNAEQGQGSLTVAEQQELQQLEDNLSLEVVLFFRQLAQQRVVMGRVQNMSQKDVSKILQRTDKAKWIASRMLVGISGVLGYASDEQNADEDLEDDSLLQPPSTAEIVQFVDTLQASTRNQPSKTISSANFYMVTVKISNIKFALRDCSDICGSEMKEFIICQVSDFRFRFVNFQEYIHWTCIIKDVRLLDNNSKLDMLLTLNEPDRGAKDVFLQLTGNLSKFDEEDQYVNVNLRPFKVFMWPQIIQKFTNFLTAIADLELPFNQVQSELETIRLLETESSIVLAMLQKLQPNFQQAKFQLNVSGCQFFFTFTQSCKLLLSFDNIQLKLEKPYVTSHECFQCMRKLSLQKANGSLQTVISWAYDKVLYSQLAVDVGGISMMIINEQFQDKEQLDEANTNEYNESNNSQYMTLIPDVQVDMQLQLARLPAQSGLTQIKGNINIGDIQTKIDQSLVEYCLRVLENSSGYQLAPTRSASKITTAGLSLAQVQISSNGVAVGWRQQVEEMEQSMSLCWQGCICYVQVCSESLDIQPKWNKVSFIDHTQYPNEIILPVSCGLPFSIPNVIKTFLASEINAKFKRRYYTGESDVELGLSAVQCFGHDQPMMSFIIGNDNSQDASICVKYSQKPGNPVNVTATICNTCIGIGLLTRLLAAAKFSQLSSVTNSNSSTVLEQNTLESQMEKVSIDLIVLGNGVQESPRVTVQFSLQESENTLGKNKDSVGADQLQDSSFGTIRDKQNIQINIFQCNVVAGLLGQPSGRLFVDSTVMAELMDMDEALPAAILRIGNFQLNTDLFSSSKLFLKLSSVQVDLLESTSCQILVPLFILDEFTIKQEFVSDLDQTALLVATLAQLDLFFVSSQVEVVSCIWWQQQTYFKTIIGAQNLCSKKSNLTNNAKQGEHGKILMFPQTVAKILLGSVTLYAMGVQQELATVFQLQQLNVDYKFEQLLEVSAGWHCVSGKLIPQPIERLLEGETAQVIHIPGNPFYKRNQNLSSLIKYTPAQAQSWYSFNDDHQSSISTRHYSQGQDDADFFSLGDAASSSTMLQPTDSPLESPIQQTKQSDFGRSYCTLESLLENVEKDDYLLIKEACQKFGSQLILFSLGGHQEDNKICAQFPCKFFISAGEINEQNMKLLQCLTNNVDLLAPQNAIQASHNLDEVTEWSDKWMVGVQLDNISLCVNYNGWDIVLGMVAQCQDTMDVCQIQYRRQKYEFSDQLKRNSSISQENNYQLAQYIQILRFSCGLFRVYFGHLNVIPENQIALPIVQLNVTNPLLVWNQLNGASFFQVEQMVLGMGACYWAEIGWELYCNLGRVVHIQDVDIQFCSMAEGESSATSVTVNVHDLSSWLDYEACVAMLCLTNRCVMGQSIEATSNNKINRQSEQNIIVPQQIRDLLKNGIQFKIDIGQIACLVSQNESDVFCPIIEIAVQHIETNFSIHEQGSQSLKMQGYACAHLLADVYNDDKLGWEPVLEPWEVQLQFQLVNTLAVSDLYMKKQTIVLNSFSISADNPLELTLSKPIVTNAGKLQRFSHCVQKSSKSFNSFVEIYNKGALVCTDTYSNSPHVLIQLHNLTGSTVHYILSEQSTLSAAHAKEFVKVADDQPCQLLKVSSRMTQKRGRYVQQAEEPADDRDDSLKDQQRMNLYFSFAGDSRTFGPRQLSIPSIRKYDLNIAEPVVEVPRQHFNAQVISEVQKGQHGTRHVILHSRLQFCNKTKLNLRIGFPKNQSHKSLEILDVEAGQTVWLPLLQVEMGSLCMKPLPSSSNPEDAYQWSQSINLQEMLPQIDQLQQGLGGTSSKQSLDRVNSGTKEIQRRLVCLSNDIKVHEVVWVNVGIREVSNGSGYAMDVCPTLQILNQLPVPCEIVVHEVRQGVISYREVKLSLGPRACDHLPHINGLYSNQLSVKPLGFGWSRMIDLPAITNSPIPSGNVKVLGDDLDAAQCCRVASVEPIGQGSSISVFVNRYMEECTEMTSLRISCAYWVYNYTGIPIAIVEGNDVNNQDHDYLQQDVIPRGWILPFNQSSQPYVQDQEQQLKRSGTLESVTVTASRSESSSTLIGLAEVIDPNTKWGRQSLRNIIFGSPVNSVMGQPAISAQWPSMFGKIIPNESSVQLRVRASQVQGMQSSYWSELIELDALGSAIVKVASPIVASGGQIESGRKAGFIFSITANRVGEGLRSWQLHVMPRFVLHNSTEWTIQYKQAGTVMVRELLPGCRKPIHWADMELDNQLTVRIQGAGWMWSGGFSLEKAGDFFVKIRQRDAGHTVLLRVDISTNQENGVILVRMSHQAVGFAPYRLDNFTAETLHVRQEGCTDQEDILKPYCHLPYAWDEPSLPHQLILELPGHRYLGTFDLDRVGEQAFLQVPSNPNNPSTRHNQREHQLHAVVLAEGPTRVLAIMDRDIHIGHPLLPDETFKGTELLGWENWSLPTLNTKCSNLNEMQQQQFSPRTTMECKVSLESIGLSVVDEDQELIYVSASGIQLRFCNSKVRSTLELVLSQVHWDNCLRDAAFPVMLAAPISRPVIGTGVLLDPSKTAVSVRGALWNRKPGGVLCAQLIHVEVAPLALEIEENLVARLISFVSSASAWQSPIQELEDDSNESVDMDPLSTQQTQPQQQKIYIEKLHISPLEMSVSFTLVQWSRKEITKSLLRRFAALADVNDARISLAAVDLSHPLMGAPALREFFFAHYFNSLLRELYKLVGAADLLGDPVRLVRHLRLGVWSLIADSASSFIDSSKNRSVSSVASGIASGVNSMIINTTFAFSNATSKMSSAARKSLLALGIDDEDSIAQRVGRRGRQIKQTSLISSILLGVAGMVSEPIKGFERGGVVGLAKGSITGALGVVARPMTCILDMSNVFANNILSYIDSSPGQLLRARVPRYVSSSSPLGSYDELKALGQQLLDGIVSDDLSVDCFQSCFEVHQDCYYVLLTCKMLLYVLIPSENYVKKGQKSVVCSPLREPVQLKWAIDLGDIEYIDRDGKVIRLLQLSVSSPKNRWDTCRSASIDQGGALPPLQTVHLHFRQEDTALAMQRALQKTCQYAPRRFSWLGERVGSTLILNSIV